MFLPGIGHVNQPKLSDGAFALGRPDGVEETIARAVTVIIVEHEVKPEKRLPHSVSSHRIATVSFSLDCMDVMAKAFKTAKLGLGALAVHDSGDILACDVRGSIKLLSCSI